MYLDVLGDICLADYKGNENELNEVSERINSFLGQVDYRIANLENPIIYKNGFSEITKAGPCLFMDEKFSGFLTKLSIDAFVLANNHIGDYGPEGVKTTVDIIDSIGKDYCGVGNFDEKYIPIRLKKDVDVSIFSICENEFGTNELSGYGSNGFNIGKIKEAVADEKKNADYVIVIFHGGAEYYPFPTPIQQQRYRLLCDFGADAVIGMHQHCLSGSEIYDGKSIYYGTGNFFSTKLADSLFDDGWNYGYVVRLCIEKRGINTKLIPYHFNVEKNIFEATEKRSFDDFFTRINDSIKDCNALRSLWDCWSIIVGSMYYKSFRRFILRDENKNDECRILSGIMTESIHELICNYVRLRFLDRTTVDSQYKEKLCQVLNMEGIKSEESEKLNKPSIMLWGITDIMFDRLNELSKKGYVDKLIIVDSNVNLQGFKCGGIRIMSPQEGVKQLENGICYICTKKEYHEQIINYLNLNDIKIFDIDV